MDCLPHLFHIPLTLQETMGFGNEREYEIIM